MLEPAENEATFRCEQCSHQAVWPFQLNHHIRSNHRSVCTTELELHQCVSCHFKSYYKLGLEHCISEQGTARIEDANVGSDHFDVEFEGWSCHFCEYQTHSSLSLIKHLNTCEMVPKVPSECSALSSRMEIENDINCNLVDSSVKDRIQCSNNGKNVEHMHKPEQLNGCSCDKCSYRTKRKKALKIHDNLLTHETADDINWLMCSTCSYETKLRNPLKKHLLTHADIVNINWFSCTDCSKNKIKSDSQQQVVKLGKNNWFACDECSYRAKRKGTVKRHNLIKHASADIEWFSCSACSYDSKLNKDFQTNAKAEGISCTLCSYRAKAKEDLTRHTVKFHAAIKKIKWFNCDKCSYRSKQKGSTKRHMLTHRKRDERAKRTNKRMPANAAVDDSGGWFNCTTCSYRDKREARLKDHMVTHELTRVVDKITFQCVKCSFLTERQKNMERHLETCRQANGKICLHLE